MPGNGPPNTFKYGIAPPLDKADIEKQERELRKLLGPAFAEDEGGHPPMTFVYGIGPPPERPQRPEQWPDARIFPTLPVMPGILVDGAILLAKLEELRLLMARVVELLEGSKKKRKPKR